MTALGLNKVGAPPATLRDIVQERLRAAIIEGQLAPGARLVERQLCDELGVSRTVVRETLRYLEAEGLVTLAGAGPRVVRITAQEARQIYDIRAMLETSAARAAAAAITPARAERLRGALNALMTEFERPEARARVRAASAFYAEVFEAAGHSVAWEIVQRLNGRISRLRTMTLAQTDRARPGLEHMRTICAAICAGDVAASGAAVEAHLKDAAALAARALEEE